MPSQVRGIHLSSTVGAFDGPGLVRFTDFPKGLHNLLLHLDSGLTPQLQSHLVFFHVVGPHRGSTALAVQFLVIVMSLTVIPLPRFVFVG